jgi:transcriptional regulator with XRE-family HTH domain
MDSDARRAGEQASFGALLRRYRVAAGLSQEALAERARLSARAISAYECGLRQAPYRDTLRLLAQALGLSPDETATLETTVSRRRTPKADAHLPHTVSSLARAQAMSRTNLPAQLTSFVGRQGEIAAVMRLLEQTRLLMLTGAGGTGKTRLALQVAAAVLDHYADGVWLVDLAPLVDPSLVPQAVAAATGVREEPGQPLLATLLAALRPRRLLLVLDNCEHLLDACAYLADGLLHACPDLCILATSRQRLGITGEVSRRIPSLTVPAAGQRPPVECLTDYEAVQLFVDRALAVQPGFIVSPLTAEAVAQVCRRLDGIPLAIELAAARLRVLSVDQIAQRLDDRFRLLTGGSRTALPRQQTLRATLEWSHALLTEPERALFRRLST